MNALAQIRRDINLIHSEMAARGIYSAAIETATYSIEANARAYMTPATEIDWRQYGLSPAHQTLMELLYTHLGKTVRHEAMFDALYFRRPNDQPAETITRVFICHIRPKLKNSPFEILTDWGMGYKMVRRAPKPLDESELNSVFQTINTALKEWNAA